MKRTLEGLVTYDKVDSTGDPSQDYVYKIDGETVPDIKDIMRQYNGREVQLTIKINTLDDE